MSSRRDSQFQTRTFEAGFEPALTSEQKKSIDKAKQGIDNAVDAVNLAASEAHNALDQSMKGHRHLVTVGISSESKPYIPPETEKAGILTSAKETIGDTVHSVKKKLIGGAETAKNVVDEALGGAKELGQGAVDATTNIAESAYDKAADMLTTAKNETMNVAEKAYTKTANLMESVKDSAGEKLGETIDSAKSLKRKAEDKLSSVDAKVDNNRSLTLEEVERRGLTADYPALLRGYDQQLPSYTIVNEQESSSPIRSGATLLTDAGHDVSSTVVDVGKGIANAATGALEVGKDLIGSVGGRVKGAVHAVIGETPPDRELEQQGERLIRESRLNPLLLKQQNLGAFSSSDSKSAYFVDKQELRAMHPADPRHPVDVKHLPSDPVQLQQYDRGMKDNFHFQKIIDRQF